MYVLLELRLRVCFGGCVSRLRKAFFLLAVLLPPFLSEAAHSVDLLQLGLYGVYDIHVVRNVDVAHVTAGHEQVGHLRDVPSSVPVQDVLQTHVHEGVHVEDATPGRALVPQLHRGHLTVQTLQQHHQAVLRDGALGERLSRHRLSATRWRHDHNYNHTHTYKLHQLNMQIQFTE